MNALEKACQGLLYPSEEDLPLVYFESDSVPPECNAPNVKWLTLDEFFEDLTEPEWVELRKVLESTVKNIHVSRIEDGTRINFAVFGYNDNYKGFRTVAIET